MKPEKILYVDDETMALKYFERLVGPIAPVLTASSVEEGRAILRDHGAEIAVLVCDQRMPGERGNELLRHTRQYYPGIVRMLTTAYSELGEAIEAINTGEIYRYISKPWELESLRADLKNALELAGLRHERDELMRDKLLAQQSQLLANRLAALLTVGSAVHGGVCEPALHRLAQGVLVCGVAEPQAQWHRWDHADLLQAEARRGVSVAGHLKQWLATFAAHNSAGGALAALAQALEIEPHDGALLLTDAAALTALLGAPAGEPVEPVHCAWLAWLLWQGGCAEVEAVDGGWRVKTVAESPLPQDWLADAMERLGRATA